MREPKETRSDSTTSVTDEKSARPRANHRAVTSPEFQYSASYNPYWEKIKNPIPGMEGLAYGDHDTEAHRGKWREQFKATKDLPNRPRLHVEIGCNAGHVSLEWAKQNPNELFIGIDYKFKVIYWFAEKIFKNELKNAIAFRANAERLTFMFAEKEIDQLHMFFPDPWPKKAQMKNRTASAEWLRTIAPLLSADGIFHLKTDHAGYFEFILEELTKVTDIFEVIETTKDLHAGNPNAHLLKIPQVTLFERLFIKDGLPIHSVKLKPKYP
jgi:tRNA (guanine-N7-)-methyltransferase